MNTRNALAWLLAMTITGTIPALAGEAGSSGAPGGTALAGETECDQPRGGTKPQKLGIVLTTDDPETVFNVFRLANFSANGGDEVSVFLLGRGVELDRIKDARFDVPGQVRRFLANGHRIMACATCLKFHNSKGSETCPVSTMQDLYDLIRASDRVLTF